LLQQPPRQQLLPPPSSPQPSPTAADAVQRGGAVQPWFGGGRLGGGGGGGAAAAAATFRSPVHDLSLSPRPVFAAQPVQGGSAPYLRAPSLHTVGSPPQRHDGDSARMGFSPGGSRTVGRRGSLGP
jgi:hypothetical protein